MKWICVARHHSVILSALWMLALGCTEDNFPLQTSLQDGSGAGSINGMIGFIADPYHCEEPSWNRPSDNDTKVISDECYFEVGEDETPAATIVAKDAVVDGEITAVNGGIAVEGGSKVANDVENVNGDIEFRGSEIGGTLTTVNGDVELIEGAVLRGDLVVEKPGGWGWKNNRMPRIVIGPGSRVEGVILLEREVELFISEAAEVGGVEGEMSLDDAVRFSGKRP